MRTVRHGLGEREVYGKTRPHSITFLDGSPAVEGVAADDYEESRSLPSPLEDRDGRLVRRMAELADAYVGLPLVNHRVEIDAAHSRDALAIKLFEDDVFGWAA